MIRVLKQYYPVQNIFFVIGEGVGIYFSVIFADQIFHSETLFVFDNWLWPKTFLITLVFQMCLYYNDLYDLNVTYTSSELGVRLLQSLGVATIFLAGIYFVFPNVTIGESVFFAATIALAILFILCWRLCCMRILNNGQLDQKIMILGSGELARNIMGEVSSRRSCGYLLVGIAMESHAETDFAEAKNVTVFYKKKHEGLCELAKKLGVRKVVVALRERRQGFPTRELLDCRMGGIDVLEGDSFYEQLTGKLSVEHINPEWLIFSEGFHKPLSVRFLKPVIDVVLSSVMLILLMPVIAITAILIKIDSEGPVFFSQERVGKGRKEYKIYKFRSMVADAEKKSGPVWAKDDDNRVTRVGKFIRKWRVDELPQLWNVLKGDMSFVGPRPERKFFVKGLEYIIPHYSVRFEVKPGVTGWAQVSYGYGASVEDATEKLNYDLFYIKNMSISMDIVIVLRTVKTVISGIGR